MNILFVSSIPVKFRPRDGVNIIMYAFSQADSIESSVHAIKALHGITNVSDLLSYANISDEIDLFVSVLEANNSRITFVRGLDVLKCPKVAIVCDTHHGYYPISTLIDYFQEEKYEYVFMLAQMAHNHFIKEACESMVFGYPRFGSSKLTRETLKKTKKVLDATYIGSSSSLIHVRASRMIKYLRAKLDEGRVQLKLFDRCPERVWLNRVSQSNLVICCTMNSQFTPQIYAIMQAGSLCLVDRISIFSGIYSFFSPGEHFVVWDDFEDLLEKIYYYHDHPVERDIIISKGYARAVELFPVHDILDPVLSVLSGKSLSPVYQAEQDKRLQICSDTPIKENVRIRLYEIMQEFHRLYERLRVLIWNPTDIRLISDLVDLPRLKIDALVLDEYDVVCQKLEEAQVLSELSLFSDNVQSLGREYDIVILFADRLPVNLDGYAKKGTLLWVVGEIENIVFLENWNEVRPVKKIEKMIFFIIKIIHKLFPAYMGIPRIPRPMMELVDGLRVFRLRAK